MGRKKTKITQPTPFGERLLQLRQKKGLSKEVLSQGAGVSTTYISLLENGERQPSREMVQKLAAAFFPEGNSLAQDELLLLAGFSPLHTPSPRLQQDLTEIYAQAVAEDGSDFQAFSALILCLLKNGRYDQAQFQLQQGFQTFNERIQLQSLLAMLELSKGRTADAIKTQQLAVEQFRADSGAADSQTRQQALANLLLNLGTMQFLYACEQLADQLDAGESFLTARARLAEAAHLAPDDVYILDEYARVCFNLAQSLSGPAAIAAWRETIAAFRAVLALESKAQLGLPMLKEASLFLALAFAQAGEAEQASLSLQLISSFCPQDWLLNYISACCLCLRASGAETGWQAAAIRHLRIALEDPDPHNRTRAEAPHDQDLLLLHAHADFRALFA